MRAPTFGSLFAGIGGFDLGFELAGWECRWQVELDPYARSVLERHWPDVRRHDDVRTWPTDDAERVDAIVGGFPCQPVSLAGKGLAQADPRWLWPEFRRVVAWLRPAFIVLENVLGLRKRGLRAVLADLADLGFDAEWTVQSAQGVGAPHRRKRFFIVASHPVRAELRVEPGWLGRACRQAETELGDDGAEGAVADANGARLEIGSSERGDSSAQLEAAFGSREALADARRERLESVWRAQRDRTEQRGSDSLRDLALGHGEGAWDFEPDVLRVAHGVPARVDRLRCLGNAVVPQAGEVVARAIRAAWRQ